MITCSSCLTPNDDNSKFCAACGAPLAAAPEPAAPPAVYQAPQQPYQPTYQAPQQSYQPTYQAPQQPYQNAQQGYQAPQQGYQQPPQGHQNSQQSYQNAQQGYTPVPQPAAGSEMKLEYDEKGRVKIGGWLLFFLVMMIVSLALNAFSLLGLRGAGPLVVIYCVAYVALIGYIVYCLFTRNNNIFICLYVLIGLNFIGVFLGGFDASGFSSVISAALWTAYFHQSRRVKATFPPR